MHKYGESKTTRIMMATVRHVTSSAGQKISGLMIFVEERVPHTSAFRRYLAEIFLHSQKFHFSQVRRNRNSFA